MKKYFILITVFSLFISGITFAQFENIYYGVPSEKEKINLIRDKAKNKNLKIKSVTSEFEYLSGINKGKTGISAFTLFNDNGGQSFHESFNPETGNVITRETYKFDDNCNLVEKRTLGYTNFIISSEYDNESRLIKRKEYDSLKNTLTYYEYIYDSRNYPVLIYIYDANKSLIDSMNYKNVFDDELPKEIHQKFNRGRVYIFRYNNRKLVSELTIAASDRRYLVKYDYEYDGTGNISSITEFDADYKPVYKTEFKYNVYSKPTSITKSNMSGNIFEKEILTYDLKGLLLSREIFSPGGNEPLMRFDFKYDYF